MEILNQYSSKPRNKEKVVVLRFLRSSEKRCIEGYCVSIHRCDANTGEVIEGSLNIFGEGVYSEEISHSYYNALRRCVLRMQKYHSEMRERYDMPVFWNVLLEQIEDVLCPIDNNGVPGDIKDLDSIYEFIHNWG